MMHLADVSTAKSTIATKDNAVATAGGSKGESLLDDDEGAGKL